MECLELKSPSKLNNDPHTFDQQTRISSSTKNRSLHERAQSTEFKALFNQYLKKR